MVRCPIGHPQETQLGSPIRDDPDWTYPTVRSGDLVTLLEIMDTTEDKLLVLAQINGAPTLGWLYSYELQQVQAATDNTQRR